jgi:hypothetical protein
MTIRLFTASSPKIEGNATGLEPRERARYRAAARKGRLIYPGPLGELVHRELNAYAEFGYRFSDDGLIPRLAAAINDDVEQRAEPERVKEAK